MAERADGLLEGLIKERFERVIRDYPVTATMFGIHTEDGRLASRSREAVAQEIADERAFLSAVEALDPAMLAVDARIDRELAIHGARRALFDDEVHRLWEQRANAAEELGDGLFLLLARDFAPLPERLGSMAERLEEAPRILREQRSRLGDRPVRLWNELELGSVRQLPAMFDEILDAAATVFASDDPRHRRLDAAALGARAALEEYGTWLRGRIAGASDDFALGPERYDELVGLRAFDGLTTDDILEIGLQQLADLKEFRRRTALEIDPGASEAEVLDRVKSDHPAGFAEALDAYRDAMLRARQHVLDHDLATIPDGEKLSVIPTPKYLRHLMPFAAYFQPSKFDERPSGIYVVTPSVDGDARAMREHNRASISNTSIHEAYPGHHLQLSAANAHPSLMRLMTDAPEFVEGWGMYSEQLMRESGFDDSPQHLLILYTDAIWRACRIILDVRLHRGEIGVPAAIDFLVEQTGFERPNATAEVNRYTFTPTYQLSYLLGKVLLLRLRTDEQVRLGPRFSLKRFHDTMLYGGSLPVAFHRRLLREQIPAGAADPADAGDTDQGASGFPAAAY